ncbi:DUF4381 domain-containing protein [Shimia sp. Alg240-R146]|uniref:DUF4381 domain-containing protein n=1 Tax=Shimia sp. Alg240-R146 TaxID=2993449 RepID=UPI0022E05F59|nr:DUF4381 domain-containing protein [Shimia sp. Alg240-R146]
MADTPDTDGLGLVDMLDLLKPVPEPEAISMMPQTQGWIWLAVAVVIVLIWGCVILVRRRHASAYRREALAELRSAAADPVKMASIVRRAALVAFPRRQVAALVGQDWVRFLNGSCPDAPFTGSAAEAFVAAPYQQNPRANPELEGQCRVWLRTHKAGAVK